MGLFERWLADRIETLGGSWKSDLRQYVAAMPSVSLGTMCSGTDSPALVLRSLLQVLDQPKEPHEQGVSKFRHLYSCEKNVKKRNFISSLFSSGEVTGNIEHLFADVQSLVGSRSLWDDISRASCDAPGPADHTDLAIGFPCQDVSNLNNNRNMNLTVIRDGDKRTGLVWVSLIAYLRKMQDGGHPSDLLSGLQGLLAENVTGLLVAPPGTDPATGETFNTNLDFCISMLSDLGWWSTTFVLDPRCFGFPVKRARVWIIAVPPHVAAATGLTHEELRELASEIMTKLAIREAREMRDLDDFLCSDDHPAVRQGLASARAAGTLASATASGSSPPPRKRQCKWPERHAKVFEQAGRDWWECHRPSAASYAAYPGLRLLKDREIDVLGYLDTSFPDSKGTIDVNPSLEFCRVVDQGSHIVTPAARLPSNIK